MSILSGLQLDRGLKFIIEGVAEAVLEENAAYIAWREAQSGTPRRAPEEPPCDD